VARFDLLVRLVIDRWCCGPGATVPKMSSFSCCAISSPSCNTRSRDRASNPKTAPCSPRSLACSAATAGRSSSSDQTQSWAASTPRRQALELSTPPRRSTRDRRADQSNNRASRSSEPDVGIPPHPRRTPPPRYHPSPRRPCGRFSTKPASTRHPVGPRRRGRRFCVRKRPGNSPIADSRGSSRSLNGHVRVVPTTTSRRRLAR
jgi:hypothetical protein